MPDSSSLVSAEPSWGELALRLHGSSPGARAEQEPISPELVLVDPELARRARTLLPEPVTAPAEPAPTLHAPSDAPKPTSRERRSFRLAVVTVCCLLLIGAVSAIAMLRAGSKRAGSASSASREQAEAFTRLPEPKQPRPQAPTAAAQRNVVDVLMPIRPNSVRRLVAQRFGPAPVQNTNGQRCSWTWPAAGLRLTLVARRGSCAQASLFSVAMWRRSWKTRAGLRIGSSVHQLRLRYPRSIRRQNGWWLLYKGGSRVSVGGLYAHVTRGRVDEFWVA
jgi:hypothetical protein